MPRSDSISAYITDDQKARFWSKVTKPGPGECWSWAGARNKNGYGVYGIGPACAAARLAHRVAFFLHHGVDPGETGVCHTCDNPPCCNPAHLFLGTQSDNMRDASLKGRTQWPGPVPRKLTADSVREIRRLASSGRPLAVIATDFGVSHQMIWKIVRRKAWADIPHEPPTTQPLSEPRS